MKQLLVVETSGSCSVEPFKHALILNSFSPSYSNSCINEKNIGCLFHLTNFVLSLYATTQLQEWAVGSMSYNNIMNEPS
jgi:hypothetical protein